MIDTRCCVKRYPNYHLDYGEKLGLQIFRGSERMNYARPYVSPAPFCLIIIYKFSVFGLAENISFYGTVLF